MMWVVRLPLLQITMPVWKLKLLCFWCSNIPIFYAPPPPNTAKPQLRINFKQAEEEPMADSSQAKPRPSRTVVRALNNLFQNSSLIIPINLQKEGWALKQGPPPWKTWKKKYLALNDTGLFYFKSAKVDFHHLALLVINPNPRKRNQS